MIVARGPRILAFEVKLSATVIDEDVRLDLLWLRDRIGQQLVDAAVLNTGPRPADAAMASPSSRSRSLAPDRHLPPCTERG